MTHGTIRTVLCCLALLGCAPAANAPQPAAPAQVSLAELNAAALAGGVTENLHGMSVADPYRSLEVDSEATRTWIDAQTEHTKKALAARRDPTAAARIKQLLSIGFLQGVDLTDDATFVTRREGDREQPAIYLMRDGKLSEEALVDPLSHGERASLDYSYPSPDGTHIAFGISANGDERATLRIMHVATERLLPDVIAHAKWTSLSWLHDGSGFYYTRYPRAGEPDFDADKPDTYHQRLFFHALGTDPDTDPLVWSSDDRSDFASPSISEDDRWLTITNYHGWAKSDLYLFDRGAKPATRTHAPDDTHPVVTVIEGQDSLTAGIVHQGTLLMSTTEGAPRERIVRVAASKAADRGAWTDLVPQGAGTIRGWEVTKNHVVVHYVENVRSRLVTHTLKGALVGDIELPTAGSAASLSALANGDRLTFTFSSFFYPPTLFGHDLSTGETTILYQIENDVDTSAYTVSQQSVASKDGTPVNVYYVHHKSIQKDGSNPVLLTGYGGFNISRLPGFTRAALYWLERGGVYAVANLRGGGEFGEDWHRAGMLDKKQNVFDDFEAVIRWFSTSKISQPGKIGISGGSNGGLLMGAMITQAPDAFAAATGYVGLYDMLRYPLFPPAELWVPEYGDPANAEHGKFLAAYSPYHQVRQGLSYPSVLIETADKDTRVYWGHSTKFAARLQQAQAGPRPIYFFMEKQMGHGRGTRLSDLVVRYVRKHAFLEHELGMNR